MEVSLYVSLSVKTVWTQVTTCGNFHMVSSILLFSQFLIISLVNVFQVTAIKQCHWKWKPPSARTSLHLDPGMTWRELKIHINLTFLLHNQYPVSTKFSSTISLTCPMVIPGKINDNALSDVMKRKLTWDLNYKLHKNERPFNTLQFKSLFDSYL